MEQNERPDPEPSCCFDDWVGHFERRARKGSVASPVSRAILEAIDQAGLSGRTVLDAGCGIGDVAIEAVRRGAANAAGIDLSREGIAQARRLAEERGVGDRTAFEVGDAATTQLPPADVVVVNRVYCCYPDVDRLLANTVGATGSVYAFSAPASRGLAGAIAKLQVAWENAWYRLRDRKYRGFRVFVHDLDDIDRRIREAGFRRVRFERRRITWRLALYVR